MDDYTKGPWRYQREESFYPGLGPDIEYQVYTESGLYNNPATCRSEANARLVSAAPDLLESLTRAETWMREYAREFDPMPLDGGQTLNMLMSDIDKAHKAIVKATGK